MPIIQSSSFARILPCLLSSAAMLALAQTPPRVVFSPSQVAVTQPLSSTHGSSSDNGKVHYHQQLPKGGKGVESNHDAALQQVSGPVVKANPGVRFAGVGAGGAAPPDTNMAVGPNHIFQAVNSNYAIFSKNGALLLGPNSLSSLWAPLGNSNPCATNNGGDVIVQYDKPADRWVLTQLGGTTAPFSECIAVSSSRDPTGTYRLYSFPYGTTLNDYPKFGIWPTATNSAYLASYNLFTNGTTFSGGQLCAYDRVKMLAGDPTAQGICYNLANDAGYLPSDLDGSRLPVDGTPGYFLNYETFSSLRMYALKPNFANPSASTFTQVAPDLNVTPFAEACSGGTCIPQAGTTQQLDSVGDRLMYRLAYRNLGDHQALVVNHSVTAGGNIGIRWYELRSPVSASATFSVYQQGTFAPDSTARWMGSAAMDQTGNIALGYSASSSSLHPAIRYTGRLASDTLGTMGTESSIVEGPGSQTGNLSRWGDYTAMRVDPTDDCTFWYTNEYLPSNGSFNWSTAFGSFKFNSCSAAPPSGSATFVKADATTKGNWISGYGADGYTVVGDQVLNPSYAAPVVSGNNSYTWTASTTDARALQKATNPADRIAATWYNNSPFLIDTNITDQAPHQVALYCLDFDSTSRQQTVDVLDSNGTILNTQSLANFNGGVYLVWTVTGPVKFRLNWLTGYNAVVSGLFFGSARPATSATFVKADAVTKGNWKQVYGLDGYSIIGDQSLNPSYAAPIGSGYNFYTWAASTSDTRALQKASNLADRIASTWYSNSPFLISTNISDRSQHQVALYCVDYDSTSRQQTVDVLDEFGNILNTQSLANFNGGTYLVWNVSGPVKFRLNWLTGYNAVVSGVFFR